MRRRKRAGVGAVAAITAVAVSFAVGAAPLMKSPSPSEPIASRLSLLHPALIYAKEGSAKLLDGRWNLGQSEAKLGVTLSAEETQQLMACTGQIVCATPAVEGDGEEVEYRAAVRVTASAVSVLRPDLLVTAKHVFFDGKRAAVPFGSCSFRSFSRRKVAIPVVVEKDQRKGYVLNNEDFIVVRLNRDLEGCNAFALDRADASLPEGEPILSVTGHQLHSLNKLSDREPAVAKGNIKRVLDGVLGGPPFYYADLDLDDGGSGGAVFALKYGRPVAGEDGRLILRGISVAYGLRAKNGKPYSDERNYTVIIGLEADFRELVEGKGEKPAVVEPASCGQRGAAKITVLSDAAASSQSEAPAASLRPAACGRGATPGRRAAKANCAALAKGLNRAAAQRAKEPRDFTVKNDTSCKICFSYDRCNHYGCWEEAMKLSGKSSLSAGVREQAPAIKNPQFCN
jgi:hypothetical protein